MHRAERGTLSRGLGILAIGWTLGAGQIASAQTDEQRSAARSIATQGAEAFNQGRFQEAADLFGRAETLMHAPPHLLFLARSQEKIGQLVKAREAYLKIVREALAPNAPGAFRDAQTSAERELKALEPRLASLAIQVEPASVKDPRVTVDGAPIPAVMVGVQRPMDPGEHRIEVSAPGFRSQPQVVRLRDGEKKSISLRLEADPSAVPAAAAPGTPVASDAAAPGMADSGPAAASSDVPAPPQDPAEGAGSSGMRIGSYVAFGVGAVGLGLGTYFLLDSSGKRSDADAAFEACAASADCRENDPAAQKTAQLDDDARSAKALSIVGFALGGVGIAAGTALFLASSSSSSNSSKEQAEGLTVRPWVGLRSAGLSGQF